MKVLYMLFLLDTLNMAVFLPVFSAFVRSLGGTAFTLGVINSSSALITLLWNPIVGSLSDQVGRKGLLSKCFIASSIGSLILCASSSSLIFVFIGRLIGALGSPVAVLLRSTVADIFKTDDEKKLFLNKSAPVISLAFLVGSLSSGFLSEAKHGYLLAFFLMAIITGLGSIITQKKLPTYDKPEAQINDRSSFVRKATKEIKTAAINIKVLAQKGLSEEPKSKRSNKNTSFGTKAKQELKAAIVNLRTISWPRYRELFIMKGLYDFSFSTIFSNVGLVLLNEFNMAGRYIGYVFFMTTIFSIVSNILKLKFNETFANISEYLKIIQGGIVLLISYVGMSLSSSVYMFLLFIGMMCFSRTFMEGFWLEMITTKSLEYDRGKVFAAYENLYPLMSFLAPVLSGLVAETYGQRVLLGSASIPISLTILMAYRQKNKTD